MSFHVFMSPETDFFFVKMHIIHALAENPSEAYRNGYPVISMRRSVQSKQVVCGDVLRSVKG